MNDLRKPLIVLAIAWTVLKNRIYNDAIKVRFTNVDCISLNKTWHAIHECRLRAIRRNQIIFNFNATVYYPIYDIRITVQTLKRANGYKPWLYNITVDACDFMRKRNNPFVKLVYNIIKDFSNMNHSCPYVGPIYVNGLYLNPETIPLPMPSGEYGLIITWYFHKLLQAYTKVYFEYIE